MKTKGSRSCLLVNLNSVSQPKVVSDLPFTACALLDNETRNCWIWIRITVIWVMTDFQLPE